MNNSSRSFLSSASRRCRFFCVLSLALLLSGATASATWGDWWGSGKSSSKNEEHSDWNDGKHGNSSSKGKDKDDDKRGNSSSKGKDKDDDKRGGSWKGKDCEPDPVEEACALYPITFPANVLQSLGEGQSFDIYAGSNPGNFGWLTWAGSPNEPTIQQSLVIPGDSHTYVNPYNSSDFIVSAGDWVQGKPGISNSKGVRTNLDKLINVPILIPVYGDVSGSGNHVNYKIVAFAEVAIQSYRLPSQNRITAKFLGFQQCAAPAPHPTPTPTPTPGNGGGEIDNDICKVEDGAIGVVGYQRVIGGITVTFTSWTKKHGEWGEFVGFTYTTSTGEPLDFIVKAGPQTFSATGFSWENPNGTKGSKAKAISHINFCDNDFSTPPVNNPPVAVSKSLETPFNTAVEVILEGTDPDGDAITFTITDGPSHGTLVDLGGGLIEYVPATGFLGEDGFSYASSDGDLSSAVAVVSILVFCPEGGATGEGVFWSQYPASIDGRVEGSIQNLTAQGFNLNSSANISGDILVPGTPNVNVNGSPNWQGVVQGDGSASPSGYWITVNSGATLRNLVTRTDPQPLPGVTAPTAPSNWNWANINNASDPSPNWAAVGSVNFNSNSGIRAVPAGAYGTFNLNSGTGVILGTAGATTPEVYSFQQLQVNTGARIDVVGPVIVRLAHNTSINGPAGAEGKSEWLVIEVNNGGFTANSQGQTIYAHVYAPRGEVIVNNNSTLCGAAYAQRIRVNSGGLLTYCGPSGGGDCVTNEPPVAEDVVTVTAKETPVVVTLLGSDPEGEAVTYSLVDSPAFGTVTLVAGVATYTPATGFIGVDTFTYRVNDGELDSAAATVSITVTNGVPAAFDLEVDTLKNTPVAVELLGEDPDGDVLTYSIVTPPASGTVSLLNGVATYTPAAGFSGTVTFAYQVTDGYETSAPATVTILVINQLPVAQDVSATTQRNTAVNVPLLANDPDGDLLTYSIVAQPANGTVSISGSTATFTPATNFVGTATFTYLASDGVGNSNVATGTVVVANTPPSADSKQVTGEKNASLDIILSGADVDGDAITFHVTSGPNHGILSPLGDGIYEYAPDAGFAGVDTFTYVTNDGLTNSQTATVTITLLDANRPPLAGNVSAQTSINTPVAVPLSGSDPDGDLISFIIASQPANGTVVQSGGVVTYTPNPGFAGVNTFTYRANDGQAVSNLATATVTVVNVANQAPLADDLFYQVAPGGTVTIVYSGSDPDGDPINFTRLTAPAGGLLMSPTPTSVRFLAFPTFSGVATFQYRASDGALQSAPATVTIVVGSGSNAPPVVDAGDSVLHVISDIADSEGNAVISLNGSASDDGQPNGILTTAWTLVSKPSNAGSVLLQNAAAQGTDVAVVNPVSGDYVFRLSATDSVYTVSDTVIISLTLGNQPPVAVTELKMTVDMINEFVTLNGLVSDDGLPLGAPLTSGWNVLDWPNRQDGDNINDIVQFSDSSLPTTLASFARPGIYLLELWADDTEYTASDVLTVYVDVECLIDVPDSAIAWWTGNLSHVDFIERRHDAVPVGGLVYDPGVSSYGFGFNGTDAGFYTPKSLASDVGQPSAGGFTIEGWISPDVLQPMPILEWSSGTSTGVSFEMGAAGELILRLPVVGGSTIVRTYPNVFTAEEWTHVGFVYSQASGVMRVFRNGVIIAVEGVGQNRFNTTQNIWVGQSIDVTPGFFSGLMDEITIYRGVLTAPQIELIYLSGGFGKCGDRDNI